MSSGIELSTTKFLLVSNFGVTWAAAVRLPEDAAKRFEELVQVIERPKTYIVTKALQEYLEEYEDYVIAMHRLNDKADRVIPEKELVKS